MSPPLGPFKLMTVNTAPERAKRLIGRVVEEMKDQFIILYVTNAERKPPSLPSLLIIRSLEEIKGIEAAPALLGETNPHMLVCSILLGQCTGWIGKVFNGSSIVHQCGRPK